MAYSPDKVLWEAAGAALVTICPSASAMPRSRTAYRFIPALEGSINLIVLSKCGRIAKGEICDEITGVHAFVQMVGLLKMGSAYPTHEGHV